MAGPKYVDDFADPPFEWGGEVYSGLGSEDAKELVTSKITETMASAEEMKTLLLTYLDNLNTAIQEYNVGTVTVVDVADPTLDSTTITAPTIPSDGTLFTDLLTRVINDLQSGATGLDAVVEQAIWDRADARLAVQEAKDQAEIEDYFAARGFDMPPGAMAGRLQEHTNERARNRTDLNDKIIIQSSNLAQANSQFIIKVAQEIKSDLLTKETEIFAARSAAQTEKNKAIVEKYDVQIKEMDVKARAAIAELTAGVDAYGAVQGLRERLAEAMANIAMQAMASLYGATNANVSLSHQTGRDQSESFNHGETRQMGYGRDQSLTESHPFEDEAVS